LPAAFYLIREWTHAPLKTSIFEEMDVERRFYGRFLVILKRAILSVVAADELELRIPGGIISRPSPAVELPEGYSVT